MERSDSPYADPPQGIPFQASFTEVIPIAIWRWANPCPDGEIDCPRCEIDYATHLASQEILNASS